MEMSCGPVTEQETPTLHWSAGGDALSSGGLDDPLGTPWASNLSPPGATLACSIS